MTSVCLPWVRYSAKWQLHFYWKHYFLPRFREPSENTRLTCFLWASTLLTCLKGNLGASFSQHRPKSAILGGQIGSPQPSCRVVPSSQLGEMVTAQLSPGGHDTGPHLSLLCFRACHRCNLDLRTQGSCPSLSSDTGHSFALQIFSQRYSKVCPRSVTLSRQNLVASHKKEQNLIIRLNLETLSACWFWFCYDILSEVTGHSEDLGNS